MKFFAAVKPDAQWRICLSGYVAPSAEYVFYMTGADDLIYLEPYAGEKIPRSAIHKVDDKGRVFIPSGFREDNVKKYLVAKTDAGVVLKQVIDRV